MHNVYRYTYTTNANYRLIGPDLFQVLWKTYSHVLPGKRLIRWEAQVASWQTAPINKHSCAKPWLYHYDNVYRYIFHSLLLLSPLGKEHDPSLKQTWIPFTHGCLVPGPKSWNWQSSSLEKKNNLGLQKKKIFKFIQCVFALSPLGN